MKQNGFVLAEFVIALPLLILLLFALGQMTFKIFHIARSQAADYVLETEAQEVLERISEDAKSAYSVEIKQAVGGKEMQEIFFNYRVVGNNLSKDLFKNNSESSFTTYRNDTLILIHTHRYTVNSPLISDLSSQNFGLKIYAERKEDDAKVNPITGGNYFANTTVTKLKFSQPKEKILHIELELQSIDTGKKFKVSTSVFMSALQES